MDEILFLCMAVLYWVSTPPRDLSDFLYDLISEILTILNYTRALAYVSSLKRAHKRSILACLRITETEETHHSRDPRHINLLLYYWAGFEFEMQGLAPIQLDIACRLVSVSTRHPNYKIPLLPLIITCPKTYGSLEMRGKTYIQHTQTLKTLRTISEPTELHRTLSALISPETHSVAITIQCLESPGPQLGSQNDRVHRPIDPLEWLLWLVFLMTHGCSFPSY